MAAPRIAPLDPPYDPDIAAMLAKWMPPNSGLEPLALFRTFAVHRDLCSRMRPLGAGILGHGLLPVRARELMIDRTCARSGAEYEWGVHAVAFGAAAGLTDEQLGSTATGMPDDPCWTDAVDRLVLHLADALHDDGAVPDSLWTALSEHFDDEQLLELVICAGWYRTISLVINAARIPLEPWAARFPDR